MSASLAPHSTPLGAERKKLLAKWLGKLKKDNLERFLTMVQMHLNINIHGGLETEDYDRILSTAAADREESPTELRPLSKKPTKLGTWIAAKSKSYENLVDGSHLFGAPLTQEGIAAMQQLIEFLHKPEILCTEGLFRVPGSSTRQSDLMTLLSYGETVRLELGGTFSAHDVATVLKTFLRELPSPLTTDEHFKAYQSISDFDRTSILSESDRKAANVKRLNVVRLLLLLLPPENYQLLKLVMTLLHETAAMADSNRMDDKNLATLFAPILFLPREVSETPDVEQALLLSELLALMIRQCDKLFTPPPALLKDVHLYFETSAVYKDLCGQAMASPAASPWSSSKRSTTKRISLELEACTTVAFADPSKRLPADSTEDTTKSELAKMFAHVQSMPDGPKKDKFLKKLQKHNRSELGVKDKLWKIKSIFTNRSRSRRRSRSFNSPADAEPLEKSPAVRACSAENILDDTTNTLGSEFSTRCVVGSSSYLGDNLDASDRPLVLPKFADAFTNTEVASGLPDANVDLDAEESVGEKLPCLDEFKRVLGQKQKHQTDQEEEDPMMKKPVSKSPRSRKPIFVLKDL